MVKLELIYAPPGAGKYEFSTKVLLDSPTLSRPGKRSVRISYTLGSVYQGDFEYHSRADINAKHEYSYLTVPGAGTTSLVGYPEVPQEGLFIAVPEKTVAKSIKVAAIKVEKPQEIPCKKLLRPTFSMCEEACKSGMGPFTPILGYPVSEYPSGKKYCEFLKLRTIHGITVAHLMLYPVHYRPEDGLLYLCPNMIIELTYDVPHTGDILPEPPKVLRDMIFFRKSEVPESASTSGIGTGKIGSVKKLKESVNRGDFIVIVPSMEKNGLTMADAVQPLLASKAKSFYPLVVTTGQIEAEFANSKEGQRLDVKLKLSIRAFLAWTLKNWRLPPCFVVLAGDVDTIPLHPRHLKDEESVAVYPSDHFYADLDTTLGPDLIVSRIPTSDPAKMKQICEHLANYSNCCKSPGKEWRKRVLMIADNVTADGIHFTEFEECLESIVSFIKGRNELGFTFISKHANSSSMEEVISEMNKGALVVNYRGHGSSISWTSTNGLRKEYIEDLDTVEMPPLVFCVCCSNAQIDDAKDLFTGLDSFAETFLGASGDEAIPRCVAIIGASRPSPHLANNDFNRYLWQSVLCGENTPGGIFQRAKTLMVQNHPDSDDHIKNIWMYMLLGDPAADVIPV
ncbi:MAG: C25 family cysteine peptidase [Syntrophobacteraceae bacterium]